VIVINIFNICTLFRIVLSHNLGTLFYLIKVMSVTPYAGYTSSREGKNVIYKIQLGAWK